MSIATIVVIVNPITTGLKFLLVNSKGSTPQMAAAGITAQGINVPPPTHIAAIWPRAVRVATPFPIAAPNNLATEPAKDIPEKPEPSKPVIAPTDVMVTAPTPAFNGTILAKAIPKSFTNP